MSKYFIVLIILIAPYSDINAQIVKFIKNPLQAKYRVYFTSDKSVATHLIFRVNNPSEIRKAGEWYIVNNPQLFKNAMTLYEVKSKDEADLIVCYISKRDSARVRF